MGHTVQSDLKSWDMTYSTVWYWERRYVRHKDISWLLIINFTRLLSHNIAHGGCYNCKVLCSVLLKIYFIRLHIEHTHWCLLLRFVANWTAWTQLSCPHSDNLCLMSTEDSRHWHSLFCEITRQADRAVRTRLLNRFSRNQASLQIERISSMFQRV
jgi:hypothetical protein